MEKEAEVKLEVKEENAAENSLNLKKLFFGLLIALTLIFVSFVFFFLGDSFKGLQSVATEDSFYLTSENLPATLGESSIIQDMPSNAKVQIYFGETGYYVLGKEIINGVIEEPDLTVVLPSSYLEREWAGFCAIVKEVNRNGNLEIELHKSELSLGVKYSSMYKYRVCL